MPPATTAAAPPAAVRPRSGGGTRRTPLSSVDANSSALRTPGRPSSSSSSSSSGKGEPASTSASRRKKKKKKGTSTEVRPEREIYTPLVDAGRRGSMAQRRSKSKAAGSDDSARGTLPLRSGPPHPSHRNADEAGGTPSASALPTDADDGDGDGAATGPTRSGRLEADGRDGSAHSGPVVLRPKRGEARIVNVVWTPAREGEAREELLVESPWGSAGISVLGVARREGSPASTLAEATEGNARSEDGEEAEAKARREVDAAGFRSRDHVTYTPAQWEEVQCAAFARWLNDLFRAEDGVGAPDEAQRASERKAARELFDSPSMRAIRRAVEKEVTRGRLAPATPGTYSGSRRAVLDEVYVREELTRLLLSYEMRWLRLGLGVVLSSSSSGNKDEAGFEMTDRMTKDSLKKIIARRVLSEPSAVRKYTGGRCKTPSGAFEAKMRSEVHQHALSQITTLVFFLDRAKARRVLADDPCLFERSSRMKSSSEVLTSLLQDCFAKQASLVRHLAHGGLRVSHVQSPLDEYDFRVRNLAADLKDGVRLARVVDEVTDRTDLLSAMRLPAATRQDKARNVGLALAALRRLGVPGIIDVTAAHVVNAHQPRILQLLWSTVLYLELPEFREEIVQYKSARRIQSHARRFLSSRSYRLVRLGSIAFQSLCRGFKARLEMRRRIGASTAMQRIWRGYCARVDYGSDLMNIIVVQCICRRFLARKRVDEMSRIMNGATSQIQRIWRGCSARIDYGGDLIDIIRAQSVARRFIARKRVDEMSREMNDASAQIQRIWRGYHAKTNYSFDRMDIIVVQSIVRRLVARNRAAGLSAANVNASTDIQRIWRGYYAKINYGFDLMDVIAVQSTVRRFLAHRAATKRGACVRKIQSTFRMWVAKRLYLQATRGVRRLQGHVRRALTSCNLESCVVRLQRVIRGWLCRNRTILLMNESMAEEARLQSPSRPRVMSQDHADSDGLAAFVATGIDTYSLTSSAPDALSSPRSNSSSERSFHLSSEGRAFKDHAEPLLGEIVTGRAEQESASFTTNHHGSHSQDNEEVCYVCQHTSRRRDFRPEGEVANLQAWSGVDIAHGGLSSSSIDITDVQPSPNPCELGKPLEGRVEYSFVKDETMIENSKLGKGEQSTSLAGSFSVELIDPDSELHFLKAVTSASIIQKAWRRFNFRKNAEISYQTICCKYPAESEEVQSMELVQYAASTKISSVYRSHLKRHNFVLQKASVIMIQTYFRRHSGRMIVKDMMCSRRLQLKRNAIMVQTHYRRHLCRSRYLALLTGIHSIQAQTRGLLTRKEVKREKSKRESAATAMQKMFRGHRALCHFIMVEVAATQIQSLVRGFLTATAYRSQREAAVIAQSLYRGKKARRETIKLQNQISVLQSAGRRLVAKLELRQKILMSAISLQMTQTSAAVQIQRYFRGYLANVDFMLLILATVKIQAHARSHIAATKYRNTLKSVVAIQTKTRDRKARRDVAICRQSSVILQAAARRFLAKLEFHRIIAAATMLQRTFRLMLREMHSEVERFAATDIQRVWRGHSVNAQFTNVVESIIAIQALVRGGRSRRAARAMIASMRDEMRCFAASEIQRVWRGKQAKKICAARYRSVRILQQASRLFLKRLGMRRRVHAATLILQRAARDMISRRNDEAVNVATTDIQRMWRGYRANVDFMFMVIKTISIQAVVRGKLARRASATRGKCVLVIQRACRLSLAKAEMRRIISAVLTIQNAFRKKLCRMHFAAETFATIEIQRIWRGYRANIDFMLMIVSTITIQSFARRILAKAKAARCAEDRLKCSETKINASTKQERMQSPQRSKEEQLPLIDSRKQGIEGFSDTVLPKSHYAASRSLFQSRHFQRNGSSTQAPPRSCPNKNEARSSKKALTSSKQDAVKIKENVQVSRSHRSSAAKSTQIDTLLPAIRTNIQDSSVKAIVALHKTKKFGEILKALLDLEYSTRQSVETCRFVVDCGGHHKMFSIIRSCNRSSPHLKLIRLILVLLTNITKHSSLISQLANEKAVNALTDMVQLFRDKAEIFSSSSSLLEKLLRSSNLLMAKYSPENKSRLHGILMLCSTKPYELEDIGIGLRSLENLVRVLDGKD